MLICDVRIALETAGINSCADVKSEGDSADISGDGSCSVMNLESETYDEAYSVKNFDDNAEEDVFDVGNPDRTADSESSFVRFPEEIWGEDSGTVFSPTSVVRAGDA
jgi:hypothetical protein